MVKHTQNNVLAFGEELFECNWGFVELALKKLTLGVYLHATGKWKVNNI